MSITRSYNKHTGTYYAYETTYVWDATKQKNVQKKRCIGQFDPETDEIIPNGRRGRPRKEDVLAKTAVNPKPATSAGSDESLITAVTELSSRLKSIEKEYSVMAEELHGLNNEISGLMKQIGKR